MPTKKGFGFFGNAWRVDAWQLNVAGLTSIDLATYVHPTVCRFM